FEETWRDGQRPRVESVVAELDERVRRAALRELIPLEIEYRRSAGETIDPAEYARRFPELPADWLRQQCRSNEAAVAMQAERPKPAKHPSNQATATNATSRDRRRRLGDYELIAKLGSGGMGAVYKAMHRRMQRVVALKVLRNDLKDRPQWLARFEREVQMAARLSHPNIVTAYDAREEKGLHYLITEYVDGHDLDRTIKRDGPLSAHQAAECVLQAARGLAYAHQQQVIHRDIKPANLLLDTHGVVKILDMGLARLADEQEPLASPAANLTESGMIMGTVSYMAPEQARNTKNADERSDIYSLGCTLHFLLTGQPIYQGETAVDVLLAHANEPIPELPSDGQGDPVPERLRHLFQRMVAKRPEDRFQRMSEVVVELEHIVSEAETRIAPLPTIINESPATTATRRNAWTRPNARRSLPLIGAGLAGLLLVIVTAIAWNFSGDDERQLSPLAGPPLLDSTAISGANSASNEPKGYVLRFDGRDSYVEVPTLQLDPQEPVTLEAIVRFRSFPGAANLFSWLGPEWIAIYHTHGGNLGIGRRHASGNLLVSDQTAPLDRWLHVAGALDGNQWALFVDGQPLELRELPFDMPETSGGLYIGGVDPTRLPADQNARFIDGDIAQVRISRGVLYHDRFTAPETLTSNATTLALYHFNTGQGLTIPDESPTHSHPATIVNAEWIEP
ncbi:MAG: protein kinase, partial [Planctomycetales bacterium]|nr:protein kinase [Planctomycetales bacterium]